MRISDWSSDVCSSDLPRNIERPVEHLPRRPARRIIGGHKNPALHRHRRLSQIYDYCCALVDRTVAGLGRKARRALRDEFFEIGLTFVGIEIALPQRPEPLIEPALVVPLAALVPAPLRRT